MTSTQSRSSQAARAEKEPNIDRNVLEKKVNDCCLYILNCCLANNKVVVKRQDINKHIFTDQSRYFRKLIKIVRIRLNDVFGLELIDMDKENNSCEKFAVRNKFKYDRELNIDDNPQLTTLEDFYEENSLADNIDLQLKVKYSMLMIALSLIFMNENEIDEAIFWESLKRLNINKDDKRNVYLGDVYKYFTSELVREGYLEFELVKGTEIPQHKFKWGYRAKLEINKKDVLDFVCEVYGGKDSCKPEDWVAQYADANKPTTPKKQHQQSDQTRRRPNGNEEDEDDDDDEEEEEEDD